MAHSEFQLEDLRDALASEKASKQLCSISDDFYKAMRNYLKELREEIEDMDMTAGTRATRLQRQYQRANNHAEDLFNRRAQKIVLSAVHRVGGERADLENMTSKEEELYHELEGLLKETKDEIFEGGYERQPPSEASGGEVKEDTKPTQKRSTVDSTEKEKSTEKTVERSEENEIDEKVEKIREEEKTERTVEGEKNVAQKKGQGLGCREKVTVEGEAEERPERKVEKTSSEKESKREDIEERTDGKDKDEDQNKEDEKEEDSKGHHLKVGDPKGSKQKEILIRVTDKIEPFVDLHGSYDLEKEDMVTLKKEIADLLVEQGKAKKIKLD